MGAGPTKVTPDVLESEDATFKDVAVNESNKRQPGLVRSVIDAVVGGKEPPLDEGCPSFSESPESGPDVSDILAYEDDFVDAPLAEVHHARDGKADKRDRAARRTGAKTAIGSSTTEAPASFQRTNIELPTTRHHDGMTRLDKAKGAAVAGKDRRNTKKCLPIFSALSDTLIIDASPFNRSRENRNGNPALSHGGAENRSMITATPQENDVFLGSHTMTPNNPPVSSSVKHTKCPKRSELFLAKEVANSPALSRGGGESTSDSTSVTTSTGDDSKSIIHAQSLTQSNETSPCPQHEDIKKASVKGTASIIGCEQGRAHATQIAVERVPVSTTEAAQLKVPRHRPITKTSKPGADNSEKNKKVCDPHLAMPIHQDMLFESGTKFTPATSTAIPSTPGETKQPLTKDVTIHGAPSKSDDRLKIPRHFFMAKHLRTQTDKVMIDGVGGKMKEFTSTEKRDEVLCPEFKGPVPKDVTFEAKNGDPMSTTQRNDLKHVPKPPLRSVNQPEKRTGHFLRPRALFPRTTSRMFSRSRAGACKPKTITEKCDGQSLAQSEEEVDRFIEATQRRTPDSQISNTEDLLKKSMETEASSVAPNRVKMAIANGRQTMNAESNTADNSNRLEGQRQKYIKSLPTIALLNFSRKMPQSSFTSVHPLEANKVSEAHMDGILQFLEEAWRQPLNTMNVHLLGIFDKSMCIYNSSYSGMSSKLKTTSLSPMSFERLFKERLSGWEHSRRSVLFNDKFYPERVLQPCLYEIQLSAETYFLHRVGRLPVIPDIQEISRTENKQITKKVTGRARRADQKQAQRTSKNRKAVQIASGTQGKELHLESDRPLHQATVSGQTAVVDPSPCEDMQDQLSANNIKVDRDKVSQNEGDGVSKEDTAAVDESQRQGENNAIQISNVTEDGTSIKEVTSTEELGGRPNEKGAAPDVTKSAPEVDDDPAEDRKGAVGLGRGPRIRGNVRRIVHCTRRRRTDTPTTRLKIKFCYGCGDTRQPNGEPLRQCATCDEVFFCSSKCQRDSRNEHRETCKGVKRNYCKHSRW